MKSSLAAIDIGTHTTRLLIALRENDFLRPILKRRIVNKIGFYFKLGCLKEEAINVLIKTLTTYAKEMEVYKVEEYMAFGTAILRQAKNKVEVIKKIKEKTGIDVKIINGQAEAKLMAKGVLSTLDISKRPILIVDIGGGSTELFWLNKKTKAISLPLGATNLTKSFLKHDPPLKTEIEHTFYKAKEVIKSTNFSTPSLLIGTAGTISTLAALDLKIKIYSPYLINGYVLEKDHISSIFLMLTSISASSRLGLRGLEEGREEIILGGTIIVLMALDVFSQNQLIVSEGGLLEGILVDYLFQKTARQYKVSYKKEDSYGNERGINL